MNLFKYKILNYFILFVISVLTLNYQNHNAFAGLDGSYFWAFNYFFEMRPDELDKVTFIYGPLAWLRNAQFYGNLILWVCLFQTVLKFLYGYLLLKLSEYTGVSKNIVFLLFFASCLTFFSTEVYLPLPLILLLVLYTFEAKLIYLILIALLTALGYYIKCSNGLTCALIQMVFAACLIVNTKKFDWKLYLKMAGLNLFALLAIGFAVYGKLGPVIDSFEIYYQNIINFNEASSSYGAADSIILLVIFGLSLIAVAVVNKDKTARLFWLLSLVLLYTSYTHGIVRMGNAHYMGYVTCFISVVITAALFYKLLARYTVLLLALSFTSFYANLGNKWDYGDYSLSLHNGAKNVYDYVINFEEHRADCDIGSKTSLAFWQSPVRIERKYVLDTMRKGTIDFFPWDLLFVEADSLTNWKPRPYLQSLNMSPYFDKNTAGHFASAEAPYHLIWHCCSPDSSFFYSFDDSYLLTNEFHTVRSIISNYYMLNYTNRHLYLRKNPKPVKSTLNDLNKPIDAKSKEWIDVPYSNGIVGCTVKYDFNMLRGAKKLLYRDDEFYIEYLTEKNDTIKRRFLPKDARDFVWVSPFIKSPLLPYHKIKRVRFSNTNGAIHSGDLKVQFRVLKFEFEKPEPMGGDSTGLFRWFNSYEFVF